VSVAAYARRHRRRLGAAAALLAVAALAVVLLDVPVGDLITVGFVQRSLQSAVPIALTAVGGLYAEKSGVFNIGVEGFMIFGAVNAAVVTHVVGGSSPGQGALWIALLGAALISLLLTLVFAVLVIRYKADQIVAGLAVWFVALGFGPFISSVVWGSRNSEILVNMNDVVVPGLSELPVVGPILFDVSPLVILTAVLTVLAWAFLYHTRYGYWIQAAGENPEALDTAGVNVRRVRYGTVLFSGVMAGLGGAALLASQGRFVGTGNTMVSGRGWIGIVAYLFGNYNPIGAAASALLFGGLENLQIQFQTAGIPISNRLMNLFPYVGVIVVLTVWGSTRMPSAVGEPYESED
jgi:simple sugar transport system permease protein